MSQTSPAKIKVKAIDQVAYVVKDAEKTAENYWNILGIGPWDIYSWEPPVVYERKYHGKPSVAKEKLAMARVGSLDLELCQPIEGDSIYQDFLKEHGEGLHHVKFPVENVDEIVEILTKEGFTSLQGGRFGRDGTYNYIYIEPLHAIWEPVHLSEATGIKPTHRYPDMSE
jgi:methylmalonyl-CoA/ethylmalonyl-CoA epimerase